VTLEDVIQKGTIAISGTLTAADLEDPTDNLRTASSNNTFIFDLALMGQNVAAGGSLEFAADLDVDARYDHGLEYLRFTLTTRAGVTAFATAEGMFSESKLVGKRRYRPVPTPGLPWMVWLPELSLSVIVRGSIAAGVSAQYRASGTVGAECVEPCDRADDWRIIKEFNPIQGSGMLTTEEQASGQLSIVVDPRLTLYLFGITGGPYGAIRPYVRGRGTLDESSMCINAVVESGVDFAVGLRAGRLARAAIDLRERTGVLLRARPLWEDAISCDRIPDSFAVASQTISGAQPGSVYTSVANEITGIDGPAELRLQVLAGKNTGSLASAPSVPASLVINGVASGRSATVRSGDSVAVRVTAPSCSFLDSGSIGHTHANIVVDLEGGAVRQLFGLALRVDCG
jgi:hypothetical protein